MFCLHILSVHALVIPNPSYSKLAFLTMFRVRWIVDFAIGLMCFGNSIGYLIITGDNIPDAIRGFTNKSQHFSSWYTNRRVWIGINVVCVVAPLVALRSLNALRHMS